MKFIKFKNTHKFVAYDGKDKYTFLEIRLYDETGVKAKCLNYFNYEKFDEEISDKKFVVGEPDFSTKDVIYYDKVRNQYGRKCGALYYPCHDCKTEYVKTALGDVGRVYETDLEHFRFIEPMVSIADYVHELEKATDEEAAKIGVEIARAFRTIETIPAKTIKLQSLSLKDCDLTVGV